MKSMKSKFIITLSLSAVTCIAASQEIGEEMKVVGPESCNEPGRYQLIIHPQVRADQYLVDTCLGRVWQQITYTDLEKTVWILVPRVDSEEEHSAWAIKEMIKNNTE